MGQGLRLLLAWNSVEQFPSGCAYALLEPSSRQIAVLCVAVHAVVTSQKLVHHLQPNLFAASGP